jgi:hypothetical protein
MRLDQIMQIKTLRLAIYFFISSCICTSSIAADDTRLAGQAMNCSAVFGLLSDVYAKDTVLVTKFHKGVKIFTEIYLKERSEESANGLNAAGVRREDVMKEIRNSLTTKAAYFREDAVICGAWAEGFMAQGEQVQFMLVYPKVVPMHIRPLYQAYANEAIEHSKR